MDAEALAASFNSFFRVSLATSAREQERLYRLRYAVYCQEFHYEKEEDCPGGMERDEHDGRSIHAQVIHRSSNTLAGCVRLVAPCELTQALPLEQVWDGELRPGTYNPATMDRQGMCEISRLAVPDTFRRRTNERISPFGDVHGLAFSKEEIRTFPLISVGLFLTAASLAKAVDRLNTFAIMEPRLARMLFRSGLRFVQIGSIKNYHGQRAPYYLHHGDAMRHLRLDLRRLYEDISASLGQELVRVESSRMETS